MSEIPTLNDYGAKLLAAGKLDLAYIARQREAAMRRVEPKGGHDENPNAVPQMR